MAIKLTDTIVPYSSSQPFPIVLSNDIQGGVHFAANLDEMNSLTDEFLQVGMLCYVDSEGIMYQYKNSGWEKFAVSKGNGTITVENMTDLDDNVELGQICYVKNDDNGKYMYYYSANGWTPFGTGGATTVSDYHLIFEDVDSMNNYNTLSLKLGSLCYVKSEKYMYFLSSDGWTKFGTGTGGGGGGGYDFVIGDEEPPAPVTFSIRNAGDKYNTKVIWIDTTTPYSLSPTKHIDRLRINYLNALGKCQDKLNNIKSKFSKIESKINNITDSGSLLVDLAVNQDKLTSLQIKIDNVEFLINDSELFSFKPALQETRKEINTFVYTIIDFYDEIMTKIDEEMGIALEDAGDKPGSGEDDDDNNNTPVNPSSIALITEDGDFILTEDGLLILPDGYEEVVYSESTLMTENNVPLLTEDGLLILLDGYSDVIDKPDENTDDVILTELGLPLLTENSLKLLKD